jgi:hypothetical protein
LLSSGIQKSDLVQGELKCKKFVPPSRGLLEEHADLLATIKSEKSAEPSSAPPERRQW